MRAQGTLEDVAAWYNPANRGKLVLLTWRWFLEYLKAIERASVPGREKLQCYGVMGQWGFVRRSRLTRELASAARHKLRRQEPRGTFHENSSHRT
jgi:hypothetical protein